MKWPTKRLLNWVAAAVVLTVVAGCGGQPAARVDRTLSVSITGSGSGTVTSLPAGIDLATGDATATATFTSGTEVELTVAAESGSVFAGWSGACSGTGSCVVTLSGDRSVTASFGVVVPDRTLSVSVAGTGSGGVVSVPAGIDVGSGDATATAAFASGTVVTLTAAAESGSVFAGWSGACSGTGSCVVTLTGDRSVTASFAVVVPDRTLSVSVAGTGSGGVVSVPAGIDVGSGDATATAAFASGTVVTLTAAAESGSVFAGWSGACSGTGSCVVTLTGDRSVTASFAVVVPDRTLSVSVAGTGSGGVVSVPAGIDVGSGDATATAAFASGTVVTLTAAAESGSVFAGWSGACTGSGSCMVTLSSDRSVTASFAVVVPDRTLSVSVAGTGSGGVVSVPAGIDVGSGDATATAAFASGTVVTLTAAAESGSVFAGWSGACSGTGSCVVTLTGDRSVTASFAVVVPDRTLSVSVAGTGSGGVVSVPAGIDVGSGDATATAAFASGTVVTLTAAAESGSVFAGWSGACSGTGSCVVTLTGDRSVTASFAVVVPDRTLSVSVAGTGSGGVVSVPAGIDVGSGDATATAAFASGTVVTLTAAAESGSVFAGWSGACTGSGSCMVTLSSNRSVTATFTAGVRPTIASFATTGPVASGGLVNPGVGTTLTWSTTGADAVMLVGPGLGAGVDVTAMASFDVAALEAGAEYTLVAANAFGSVEEGVVAARAVPAFGVLIAGQSNAQGVNLSASQANAFISAASFVRMLGNDYVWKAAYEPLDDCAGQVDVVSADPPGCAVIESGVSSGVSLGNGASAATGGSVFLVPAARGGTSASQWAPVGDRFDRSTLFGSAAYRAREVAREQGAPLGLVFEGVPYGAVVWYQGETDSNTTSNANAFESRTRTVLDAFRAEIGAPTILVQLSRRGEVAGYSEIETVARNLRYQRLRETQRRLATDARTASGSAAPNTLPSTFLVVTHDLPMHPGDGRHLSAAGQVELGRRISLAIREHLLGDATVDGSGPQLVAVEKRSNTETWVRTSRSLRPPSVTTAAAYGDYFAVISGDASIPISSISLLSGDSSVVRIVHASAPGPVEVRYMPPPGIITSLVADVVRSASCDEPIPGSGGLCLPMAAFGDVFSLTEDDTMRNNQFYETE